MISTLSLCFPEMINSSVHKLLALWDHVIDPGDCEETITLALAGVTVCLTKGLRKKKKNTEALLFDAVLVYKSKVNQSSGGQVLRFSL